MMYSSAFDHYHPGDAGHLPREGETSYVVERRTTSHKHRHSSPPSSGRTRASVHGDQVSSRTERGQVSSRTERGQVSSRRELSRAQRQASQKDDRRQETTHDEYDARQGRDTYDDVRSSGRRQHRSEPGGGGRRGGEGGRLREVPIDAGGSSSDERHETGRHRGHVIREILPDDDEYEAEYHTAPVTRTRVEKSGRSDRFLKKVQHELEEKRDELAGEVERLTLGAVKLPTDPQPQGSSSYVDTSSGDAVFKAFFDVSGYPAKNITVSIDKITNKIIVVAKTDARPGAAARSFTQRVQLPRFADEQQLRSKLSRRGMLRVQVPLLYYFKNSGEGSKEAKSFVNGIKTDERDGQQMLEILVNAGAGVEARDLHVEVDGSHLVVSADTRDEAGRRHRRVIKDYTVPELADVDGIRSRYEKDGRLAVIIPLHRAAEQRGVVRTIKHEVTRQHSGYAMPASYHGQLASPPVLAERMMMQVPIGRKEPSHRVVTRTSTLPAQSSSEQREVRETTKQRKHATDNHEPLRVQETRRVVETRASTLPARTSRAEMRRYDDDHVGRYDDHNGYYDDLDGRYDNAPSRGRSSGRGKKQRPISPELEEGWSEVRRVTTRSVSGHDRPRDSKYSPRDDEYSPRDREYSPRDREISPRDREISPRDREYSQRDREYSPRDREISPRDREYSPRDERGGGREYEAGDGGYVERSRTSQSRRRAETRGEYPGSLVVTRARDEYPTQAGTGMRRSVQVVRTTKQRRL